jgi:dienelactone hydrolase
LAGFQLNEAIMSLALPIDRPRPFALLGIAAAAGFFAVAIVSAAQAQDRTDGPYRNCFADRSMVPAKTMSKGERIVFTIPASERITHRTGLLHLPPDRPGPFPVVVMLPGSAGVDQRQDFHRTQLLQAGIGTFVIDTKCGIYKESGNRPPHRLFLPIGFEALRVLRARPEVDKNRIAVLGWSFGGTLSLRLAHVRYTSQWLRHGERGFAAHVGLYGGCTSRQSVVLENVPVLVLIGRADTYTDPNRCSHFKDMYSNVSVVEYPDVHHGFDKEDVDQTRRGRIMRWHRNAAVDARRRVVRFFVETLRPGEKKK